MPRTGRSTIQGKYGDTLTVIGVDGDGNLLAVMKGDDAGTLRTIAVDSSGQLISVIKGSFAGTLKTISVDTAGRIEAFVQGNIPYAGPVIFYDNFESAILKWTLLTLDASSGLTTQYSWSGDKSLYLKGNGAARVYGYVRTNKEISIDITYRYGVTTSFSFLLRWYDGTNEKSVELRYSPAVGAWYYLNSSGNYIAVPGGTQNIAPEVWNRIYAEFDFNLDKYGIFKSNELSVDMSSISCQSSVSALGGQLNINVLSNDEMWIDNVLVIEL